MAPHQSIHCAFDFLQNLPDTEFEDQNQELIMDNYEASESINWQVANKSDSYIGYWRSPHNLVMYFM